MLYIVASYHCMQFQGKLMNQTWQNDKKPSFEPDYGKALARKLKLMTFSRNWEIRLAFTRGRRHG